jgi:hypothetical protein
MKLAQEVLKLAKGKPIKEVKEAAEALWDEYKHLHSVEMNQKCFDFRPGRKCIVTHRGDRRLPKGAIGLIEKANQKTISVDFGRYRKWRITPDWIEPYDGEKEVEQDLPPMPLKGGKR